MRMRRGVGVALVLAGSAVSAGTPEADWPMWRYDAKRSAASPHALPRELEVQWILQWPPLRVAWPDEPRMTFDAGYLPIVSGKTLFIGSSHNDSLTAVDTDTGRERWRFYAQGPIRLAPVAWRGKVYFACDDGYLYCLDALTGEVRWKIRGGPTERRLLGNERLISAWPARGGPVVADGVVYFAAGIWPFMGIFIYALDAESGKEIWVNDAVGSIYINQPHNSPAFAGPAPQGHMALAGDRLLVSGGRSVPACLDRRTGTLAYYQLAKYGKQGAHLVGIEGEYFANDEWFYSLTTGDGLGTLSGEPVLSEGVAYTASGGLLRAFDLAHPKRLKADDKAQRKQGPVMALSTVWERPSDKEAKVFIKAGPRLYGGNPDAVWAVDVPPSGGQPKVSWQARISGTPHDMLAADGKLFVVTRQGRIYCFGAKAAGAPPAVGTLAPAATPRDSPPTKAPTTITTIPDRWEKTAESILKARDVRQGYAFVLGVGSGRLLESLARRSELCLIGLDPSATKVNALRRRFDAAGLYASRIALLVGDVRSIPLPPYLADLIVSEDLPAGLPASDHTSVERLFDSLRPYGGMACLPVPPDTREAFASSVAQAKLENARIGELNEWLTLTRTGALPGAANWTHLYADAANTCVSADRRVKTPLGLLWFGGVSNVKILPRHGHGPSELVIDGRLFIEGPDILRAIDIYTGRRLWEAELPGLGKAYDHTVHQPGASAVGSNYAATADGVYVAYGESCVRLDPASGRRVAEFKLPKEDKDATQPIWGCPRISGDLLVATASPISLSQGAQPGRPMTWDGTSSKRLVVLNRHSGKVLWTFTAENSIRHNAICAGAGKVFFVDGHPEAVVQSLRRRGQTPSGKPALQALDLQTGSKRWTRTENVFGTWLSYSEPHDVLLQAGRASRDMLPDEPSNRMIACRGSDGSVLWDKRTSYQGPCMIHGKTIITQGTALDLLTGEPKMRPSPITGEEMPWRFSRTHGCGTAIGSEHLLTFRSAAAGYCDLTGESGTGNLGGFRSGCTSNLVAAGGLLNAPDYTKSCICSYQNQCSLALVHMPEIETWSFNDIALGDQPVRRMGINLGAPGDRMAGDGVLWLEYPRVGGPSPLVTIAHEPGQPKWFCRHSSRIQGNEYTWVAASGAIGLTSLRIQLAEEKTAPRRYRVRLVFCEPEAVDPGRRLFDVAVQGRTVLTDLDVAREARGPMRPLIKTIQDVNVTDALVIALTPKPNAPLRETVLSGVETVQVE